MKPDRESLFDLLARHVGDSGIVSLSVSASSGAAPETVWTPTALAEEPRFLAYSITKVFTATVFVLLQEEGRVDLDATLSRWFPEVPRAEEISLRRLLDHSSGLPDYGGLPAYHAAVQRTPRVPWDFERFAAETYAKGLSFAPGDGWAYSNPGYMLLRRVAEAVAGESYERLVSRLIAVPVGLDRTSVAQTPDDLLPLAPAPSKRLSLDGSVRDTREFYHPGWVSHGVLRSCASEIASFFDALFGGRLVAPASLRQMQTLVPVPAAHAGATSRWRRPSYGLGLMSDPDSPLGIVFGHNGGGPGASCSAFHAPDLAAGPVTVCAMCNVEDDNVAENLVFEVLGGFAGGDADG